jgi:hypothetical protein
MSSPTYRRSRPTLDCSSSRIKSVRAFPGFLASKTDPKSPAVILQMQLADKDHAESAEAPPPLLAEAIRSSFLSGTRDAAHITTDGFLAQHLQSQLAWGGTVAELNGGIGEYSLDWQLARPQMAKALSLHLMHCKSRGLLSRPERS